MHKNGQFYQHASYTTLLGRSDLNETQRRIIEIIQKRNESQYSFEKKPTDLGELIPLLAKESFTVACGSYYYNQTQATINLTPPPIPVDIVHTRTPHPNEPEKVRHKITLRLPNEKKESVRAPVSQRHAQGIYLLHENNKSLNFYALTAMWANILGRVSAVYHSRHQYEPPTYTYHGTTLQSAELKALPKLLTSVPDSITLTVPDNVRTLTLHTTKPKRVLAIMFDSAEHYLHIAPLAEYGFWQSDIAENISRRYTGRVKYIAREVYEERESHVIVEHEGLLHTVRRTPNEEIAFYKELEQQHEELGFTKTLKYTRRGRAKIADFISTTWQTLRTHAQKKNYEIRFLKDTLPTERIAFRTDFSAPTVNTEKDWLHFDLAIYCGDERVTLEKLYAYMQSGDPYWRKDDGTLVEIENTQELERLVRLLKSFQAHKNGGFEGKLHHAPELQYVMTSSPHYNTARSKSLERFMKRVESGKPVKKVRLPATMEKTLRPYQKEGVQWLHFLRSYRFAGILADDMGLGKTLQALTVLYTERKERRPSVIICPKTLIFNWKNEAAHFFPSLTTLVYEGSPQERAHLSKQLTRYDVVIMSYHTLKQDEDLLFTPRRRFNYAVLDEAQNIKNHATKTAQVVKKVPADYRLALTGTPLENNVSEIWSIYDLLMPHFLGSNEHFNKHFHKPIMEASDREAMAHLRHKVESFMLRRTKTEVLTDLPPKVEQESICVLSEAQNVLYQQILADVRGDIFQTVETKGFKSSQIHILAGLTKLRQACNHPALLTKDKDYSAYDSAKLDMCVELINEVVRGNRKVLVFSQFTGMLDILSQELKQRGVEHAYLSGKTRKREQVVERFNTDPTMSVFLISLKAGGTGLNLTSADTVIIFDPWWNPSVENQAVDRAHRIGQTQSVNVYRLLTKGTIEEKIQALKAKKQDLFNAVVEESGDMFKNSPGMISRHCLRVDRYMFI